MERLSGVRMPRKNTVERIEAILKAHRSGKLKWRHHGVGMLQAYYTPTQRVHVWHPDLLLPGMTTSGAMHNHRFAFESEVLLGSILHTHLSVTDARFGAHQLFAIENASEGRDCDIVAKERVSLETGPDFRFEALTVYRIDKWAFHWARPYGRDLAVTWVEIQDKNSKASATLVAPYGTQPVHALAHNVNAAMVQDILNTAMDLLKDEV